MFTGSITNLLCPTLAGSFLLLGYCFTLPVYFFSLPDSFVTFPMPLNLTFSLHTPLTREESHQAGDSYTSLPFISKWIHIFVPILLSFLSSKRFLDLLSWPSHPSTFSHLPHLPTSDAYLLLILITIAMKLLFVRAARPNSHHNLFLQWQNIHNMKPAILSILKCIVQWH